MRTLNDSVEAFIPVAPQTLPPSPTRTGEEAVSYTHLDVYKRQVGGKKRSLDEIDEGAFDTAEAEKDEKEIVAEDEGFVVSDADDTDEPEQQVMAAGATADPVKDLSLIHI